MELTRAQAAIKKLAENRSVYRVLRLNEVRKNPTRAADPNYRSDFIAYYRMGRRTGSFYKAFFEMLQDAAVGRPLSLTDALTRLYAKTGQRHLSFCSKLLATINDDGVIFDRNVASYFSVRWRYLPKNGWLNEALRRYGEVRKHLLAFTEQPAWPAMRALFDEAFPAAVHLPDIRKADLIVWASYG